MALESPLVHAPDLQTGTWINASSPPIWQETGAGALLVDFSDFTCINCLRTLPYLRAWHRRYAPHLFVMGIHTPEFSFAHDPRWVAQSAGRLGVRWPILMDNQQEQWTSWAVHAWPTLFIVDRTGFIRVTHVGDRGYPRIEEAFRTLIHQTQPEFEFPTPLGSVRPEDELGAVCRPVTPELQADEVDLAFPALDAASGPRLASDSGASLQDGYRLDGDWTRSVDGWHLANGDGAIRLAYQAAEVNAVLAPSHLSGASFRALDADLSLGLHLDGRPIPAGQLGADAFRTSAGTGLRLDVPRLYNLVKSSTVQRHELRLSFAESGPTFYAFSFGSCLMPPIHHSSS